MNETKVLILKLHDEGYFIDRTREVSWYEKRENAIRVKFVVKGDKFYNISYRNMLIFEEPLELKNFHELSFNDQPLKNATKVLKFEDYIKVFWVQGNTSVFHVSQGKRSEKETQPDTPTQSPQRFEYFKALARTNQKNSDILYSLMSELEVNPHSVLHRYLYPSTLEKLQHPKEYIYPFGLNLSQKAAVERAFSRPVSIIEGPPGTGKKQTILNIVANAVYTNQTIAVVSNNNSAIENVRQKLKEHHFDFMTALLGNKENKTVFFEEEVNKPKPLSLLKEDKPTHPLSTLKEKVSIYKDKLLTLYEIETTLAQKELTLRQVVKEYDHFRRKHHVDDQSINRSIVKRIRSSEEALSFYHALKYQSKLGFFKRLRFKRVFGEAIKNLDETTLKAVLIQLLQVYYLKQQTQLSVDIKHLKKQLEKESFEEAKHAYESLSNTLFKSFLYKKYRHLKSTHYSYDRYRAQFNSFLEEYPVVLSTTYTLIPSARQGYLFDYLIIDEASQTDLMSSILAFSCAKKVVIVGDTKQLTHIENTDLTVLNESLMAQYRIEPHYD